MSVCVCVCAHIFNFFSVLPHSLPLPLLLLHYLFIMYANAFNCMDSGSTKRRRGREERERRPGQAWGNSDANVKQFAYFSM